MLDASIVEAKLSSRGSTLVASMYQALSYVSKLSSRGSARQCTNSDGDNAAPCLLKGLATPYLLRRLATPYLLRRLATPYLLRGLATPCLLRGLATAYFLRRHYSLVIASRPEVAFVTPAITRFRFDRIQRVWSEIRGARLEGLIRGWVCIVSRPALVLSGGIRLILSGGVDLISSEGIDLISSEGIRLISSGGIDLISPEDLKPRLPDPNFRMINLPARDTTIGIYSMIFDSLGVRIPFSSFLLAVLKYFKVHISQLVPLGLSKVITFEGDWFSFAKRGDPAPVCMEVAKSGLKLWKEKIFLIDRRAIPFHMPWRHPDSFIGIYDFHCMPSLDKVTVREEPHGLNTFILGKVTNRTSSPALVGTTIPRASPEEIAITRPDRKVVTKADHAAKRKASTRPEISTNVAKKTRSNNKGSGAGSSGQAAGDEVEQTDDGTLNDDQLDGLEFAMEGIESLTDVNQGEHINVIPLRNFNPSIRLDAIYPPILLLDKGVKAHAELSGGLCIICFSSLYFLYACVSEDTSPHAQEVAPAPDAQPLDVDAGADEIASDGPYYIPYPYDEGSGSESPPYTKEDGEEIHGVNL
ncbi:hypothetical protein Tco_0942249, partial [Tanacetum coccineum]